MILFRIEKNKIKVLILQKGNCRFDNMIFDFYYFMNVKKPIAMPIVLMPAINISNITQIHAIKFISFINGHK
jgi:hypothetical protein